DEAEGEPRRVRVTAEVDSRDERHARLQRAREQLGGVELPGQLQPDEVAALGPAPAGAPAEAVLERLEHRIPSLAQQAADTLQVRLEQAAAQEFVQRRLRDEPRGDVRRRGATLELGRKRRGGDQVPDAQPRRNGLRERRAIANEIAALELEQARKRLAFEADEPVRIVLEHG